MPVTKGGFVVRRVVRGCAKLCKGFKGRIGDKTKPFGRCFSKCISFAQTGTKRGLGRIPKDRKPTPCSKPCPKAKVSCLKRCFKRKLKVPKRRETMTDVRRAERRLKAKRKTRR
jgi:hypothetical protein